jgi:hypothetical protein
MRCTTVELLPLPPRSSREPVQRWPVLASPGLLSSASPPHAQPSSTHTVSSAAAAACVDVYVSSSGDACSRKPSQSPLSTGALLRSTHLRLIFRCEWRRCLLVSLSTCSSIIRTFCISSFCGLIDWEGEVGEATAKGFWHTRLQPATGHDSSRPGSETREIQKCNKTAACLEMYSAACDGPTIGCRSGRRTRKGREDVLAR